MTELFRNPLVPALARTLSWCLQSPDLVNPLALNAGIEANGSGFDCQDIAPHLQSWLDRMDKQTSCRTSPAPSIEQWQAACHSKRLGHQFERYWHYYWRYIAAQPNPADWLFNQQINDNGTTLGEIDALNFDANTDELHHYELAIKFYLGYNAPDSSTLWLGPNCRDRLDLKLSQMCHKQLTLLERHPQAIPGQWPATDIVKHLLVKGWLFYPFKQPLAPPDYATDCHNRGSWLHQNQLRELTDDTATTPQWVILRRSEWLDWFLQATDLLHQEQRVLDSVELRAEINRLFETEKQYCMVIQCQACSADPNYVEEAHRYMVVGNNWPESLPSPS
ncbi:MAG: hypothetical protein AseanaTS_18370 [Candidatus Pelagadaptatus aseana]|uniref:DUF1853 family protein n=1 Tax=Candidatus Pelagadaptatus aseana TaxID=3120508 RepID=UPI0039B1EBF9